MLSSLQNAQSAVMTAYGVNGPPFGSTMLGLSNGWMRGSEDPGFVDETNTKWGHSHSTSGGPLGTYLAAHDGQFPASESCYGTCPLGSGANDAAVLKVRLKVPSNARGFSFEYRFFSSEYRQYQCTSFNDRFLVLLDSRAEGLPSDKNIARSTQAGSPVSVTSDLITTCDAKGCMTCPEGTYALSGTGMEGEGGATRWRNVSAPVVPGETITLHFMIFDVTDAHLDSNVLLDRFAWLKD